MISNEKTTVPIKENISFEFAYSTLEILLNGGIDLRIIIMIRENNTIKNPKKLTYLICSGTKKITNMIIIPDKHIALAIIREYGSSKYSEII